MSTNSKEFGFVDYLLVLARWRKLLVVNFIAVGAAAVILSLLLPKYYKATAIFLPPSQSSGLTALIKDFSFDVLGSSDIAGEACLTILESRGLRQEIIDKFDLMELYKEDYVEHALIELESNVIIEADYQVGIGVSTISSVALSVIDKEPQRAADMANEFLRLLEERIIEVNTKKARNNRMFLETRLEQNKQELKAAEDTLRAIQEAYGAIEVSAQAKASIAAAAQFKSDILAVEIERNILSQSVKPNNAALSKLNTRLAAMTKEYDKFYEGFSSAASDQNVLIPIKQIPTVALKYYRAFRETEIQNRLFEMLVPMYEQARIQESKTIPVLKVIDHAVPPTYKYKPKRLFIVAGILAVSTLFCLLYIFYREYLTRLKDEDFERYRKIVALSRLLSFRHNDVVSQ